MTPMPPLSLYRPERWPELVEKVLARTWHVVASVDEVDVAGSLVRTLLPGVLDEPVLLTRVDGELRAFSAVCTHRAAVLEAHRDGARCPYHGRRFAPGGRCVAAPGFDHPTPADDLPPVPLATLGPLIFVAIAPAMPFDALFPHGRLAWLPPLPPQPDPAGEAEYTLDAHFLLYVENYLEGLHVPFVHPGLAAALDLRDYRVEPAGWSSLQVGVPRDGGPVLHAPDGPIAAAWVSLFPTTMLNHYPWGLSVNVVEPLGPGRTRVRYRRWVRDPARLTQGAGGALDQVEREDDTIVERVHRGAQARLARPGRHAPKWEDALAHFHARIGELLGA